MNTVRWSEVGATTPGTSLKIHKPLLVELAEDGPGVLDRLTAEALTPDDPDVVGMIRFGNLAPPPRYASRWGAGRGGRPTVVTRYWPPEARPKGKRGCGLCGEACDLVPLTSGWVGCLKEEGDMAAAVPSAAIPRDWFPPVGDLAPEAPWICVWDRPGRPTYVVRSWAPGELPAGGCGLCNACVAAPKATDSIACVVGHWAVPSPG
jgi:hypothetical protein